MKGKKIIYALTFSVMLAANMKFVCLNRTFAETQNTQTHDAAVSVDIAEQNRIWEQQRLEKQIRDNEIKQNWSLEDGTLTIEDCAVFGLYNFKPPWDDKKDTIKRAVIKGGNVITGFMRYPALEDVSLPDTAKEIDMYAFKECIALKSIDIPNGVTMIGTEAFINCYSLSRVTLPDTLTEISVDAFKFCPLLKSIELPESLNGIGKMAFFGTGIKSVKLPRNLTRFSNYNNIIFDTFTEVLCYKNSVTAKNLKNGADINVTFLNDDDTLYEPPETSDDFDESRAVQLTDYRYLNKVGSKDGYCFMNIFGTSQQTTKDNDRNLLEYDSVILNPDGTELCEQGAYTAECHTTAYPYVNGYFNLYARRGFADYGSDNLTIMNKNGEILKKGFYPFAGFLDDDRYIEGDVNSSGKVTAFMVKSLGDDKKDVAINGSVLKVSADKKHFNFKFYDYGYGSVLESVNEVFKDEYDNNEADPGCEFYEYTYKPEAVYTDERGDTYYTADKSYVVKGKNINGKIYYALFKVLKDGESAEDYIPKEKPDAKYQAAVKALTDNKILYNNSNCRYKQRITKKDFYTVILESYLGDREYNDYLKDNTALKILGTHYCSCCFSSDAYVRLAMYTGLAEPINVPKLYRPSTDLYDGLTVQKAQELINSFIATENLPVSVNITELCGAKPYTPLTREMAYAVAYEIYKS